MKKSYTILFLFLASVCLAQDKDAAYYKQQFHSKYEHKHLSLADSIKAAICLHEYIVQSLEDKERETAQIYANILYAYVGTSRIPELKIKFHDTKLWLPDEHATKEVKKNHYRQIIRYCDTLLLKSPNDTKFTKEKGSSIRSLAKLYRSDSAMVFATKALQHAKKHKLLQEEQYSYSLFGELCYSKGTYQLAMEYYDDALRMAERRQDSSGIMSYSMNKGVVLHEQGVLRESTVSFFKALDYASALGKSRNEARIYLNLYNNYVDLQDDEKALEILEKAKKKSLEADYQEGLLLYYDAKSKIYDNDSTTYDKALLVLEEEINLAKELKDTYYLHSALISKGFIHTEQEQYVQAKVVLQEALNLVLDKKWTKQIAETKLFLGRVHLKEKNYTEALKLIKAANTGELNSTFNKQLLTSNLAETYAGLQQFDKAYPLYVEYKTLQDSMLNEENIRSVTRLEADYTYRQDIERRKLLHQIDMERQSLVRRSLLAGLGLVGLLAFFIFINLRNKAKVNRLLEQKNKEISYQKEQLEELNYTKDRIFAIIGHDLRKPALSFKGISKKVNYLIKKQDFDTLGQFGAQIEENALALNKLTDNLLNWALTQRNVMPYKPVEVALNEHILEVENIFAPTAREKGVQIFNQTPKDISVYADPNALRTILINLIDNAIKYTPEGGTIKISALEGSDKQLKIRVSDTGVGMAKDQLNDLFLLKKDKSKRGTAGEKGTGLGMHLVKELVELNKGRISAVSELGKGTSFDLILPTNTIVQISI